VRHGVPVDDLHEFVHVEPGPGLWKHHVLVLNKSKELLDRLEKDDGTRLIVLGLALRQGSMSVAW
jgi:hypothetical protein